jgi:hypothetical protein
MFLLFRVYNFKLLAVTCQLNSMALRSFSFRDEIMVKKGTRLGTGCWQIGASKREGEDAYDDFGRGQDPCGGG